MLKLCRQYLNWIQNSVLEGEISEVKPKELKAKAEKSMVKKSMVEQEDSLIIFKSRQQHWPDKEVIGLTRNDTDHFL